MRLTKLVMDVCRGSRLLLGQFVSESSPRPYNQLRLLQLIKEGEIHSQTALAERLFLDPPSVSRAVDKLEADGLLRRLQGDDRRCVKLEATTTADVELAHFDDALGRLDHMIEHCLDEKECADFRRLLTKLETELRHHD